MTKKKEGAVIGRPITKEPPHRLPPHEKRVYAARSEAAKITQRKRKLDALRKNLENGEKKLKEQEKRYKEREELIEKMSQAPTPAKQRGLLFAKFAERDFDPIEEMIEYAMDKKVPKRERVAMASKLAELTYAKPKSVDIQGNLGSNVSVFVMDFNGVSKKELKQAHGVPEAIDVEGEDQYDSS